MYDAWGKTHPVFIVKVLYRVLRPVMLYPLVAYRLIVTVGVWMRPSR
jgi:hypothetical protein